MSERLMSELMDFNDTDSDPH